MPDMWYVVISLSLAMGIGYLVKYSSVVRSILGLPENSDYIAPNTAQVTPLSSSGTVPHDHHFSLQFHYYYYYYYYYYTCSDAKWGTRSCGDSKMGNRSLRR